MHMNCVISVMFWLAVIVRLSLETMLHFELEVVFSMDVCIVMCYEWV